MDKVTSADDTPIATAMVLVEFFADQ